MTSIRIIVTGGRHRQDRDLVWEQLDQATVGHDQVTIVHGACPTGIDQLAHEWCQARAGRHGGPVIAEEQHPADWATHGQAAGPIRNTEMVRRGADLLLAFPDPDSRGSWHCARKGWDARIPVRLHRTPEDTPQRIQRRRERGWRMPYSAITVTRPGPFGSPYPVGNGVTAEESIARYRDWAREQGDQYRDVVRERLAGWDLACFCKEGAPCHGDVLLWAANGGDF